MKNFFWLKRSVMLLLSRFSHVRLFESMDCSQPGSSIHGILQVRILEWVAMPSSRGSSWPRDQIHISCDSCTAGGFFYPEPLGKPWKVYSTLKSYCWLLRLISREGNAHIQSASRPLPLIKFLNFLQSFFFLFYWDIVDIQHHVSLRHTAQQFDLHTLWQYCHSKYSEHPSSLIDIKVKI